MDSLRLPEALRTDGQRHPDKPFAALAEARAVQHDDSFLFHYDYLYEKKFSLSYSNKLIGILNAPGHRYIAEFDADQLQNPPNSSAG